MWLPALKPEPVGKFSIQVKPRMPAATCQPIHCNTVILCVCEVLISFLSEESAPAARPCLADCELAAAASLYQ